MRSRVEPGTRVTPLPCQELNERKILLVIGMEVREIAFWKMYEKNVTMNAERYKQFLEQYLKRSARQHRTSRPVLLHDNARPQSMKAVIICEYKKKRRLVGTESATIFS